MRWIACMTALALIGCTREVPGDPPVAAADGAVVASALAAWSQRLAVIRDYAVEGEVKDAATGQSMRFRYAMQQPTWSAGELLGPDGARARGFIFNNKILIIINNTTKSVLRQEFGSSGAPGQATADEEEAMLLQVHEIFSQFVCEGWRPPLIKPQGTTGTRVGELLVLSVPIVDDDLAFQRLTLKADGAFVKKELLDKRGNVVSQTAVLEDVVDDATHLALPKRWSHTEGGSTQEVTLTKIAVNQGVDAGRFSTAVPAGFQLRTKTPEVQP